MTRPVPSTVAGSRPVRRSGRAVGPTPARIGQVATAARLMRHAQRQHRGQLGGLPAAAAAVGVMAVVLGWAYVSPAGDAIVLVSGVIPVRARRWAQGVGIGAGSLLAAGWLAVAAPPTPTLWLVGVLAVLLIALLGLCLTELYVCRRFRQDWRTAEAARRHRRGLPALGPPARQAPAPVGARKVVGFGAAAPGAGMAWAATLLDSVTTPLYTVAATPTHARLYQSLGFAPYGPAALPAVPMLRPGTLGPRPEVVT